MTVDQAITATHSVRDVLSRHPQTETIFNKYGLTGCGGRKGPMEPIGFFATVHHVDPDVLLKELNEAVREGNPAQPPPANEGAAEEADIYRPFVKTALVIVVTVGCLLGAINLAAMALAGVTHTYWEAVTQAHGHAQIFGWVGLFIMGVSYHVLPRLKATQLHSRPLAMASFWLVLGGIALRMVAQPFATAPQMAGIVVLSAVAELAGATLFAYIVVRTLSSNPASADFWDRYVVASAGWFWVSAVATLATSLYMAAAGLAVIPPALNAPYLHAALMGFAGMMIMGITLRTIPVFMGLRTPNERAFGAIFWALNLGIAIKVGTGWADAMTGSEGLAGVASAATLLESASIFGFALFLGIFARPERDVSAEGASRGYEKFVRAAYFWLLVSSAMVAAYSVYHLTTGQQVPHAFVGAYRHALTVGFISMIIIGMASRIIPVFTGVRLHSEVMLLGTFVLLNVGNTVRVVSQPLADTVGGLFFVTMGASGFVEVVALGLFVFNIWRTIDSPVEDDLPVSVGADGAIRGDMIVAEVLKLHPSTLDVFVQHGFTQLQNPIGRRTLARAVTVQQATEIKGVDLGALLQDLNTRRVQAGSPLEGSEPPSPAAQERPAVAGPPVRSPVPLVVRTEGASGELVTAALSSVYDPEIPVNVVDLGLIEQVRIDSGAVEVDMILTAPGCPMSDQMVRDIEEALGQIEGVSSVQVSIVDSPEWTSARMSEAARDQLGMRIAS